jgi:transposase
MRESRVPRPGPRRTAGRPRGRPCSAGRRCVLSAARVSRGLRRIGIDEISWRRGQRYLTVALDHDSGRPVGAAEGRDEDTLDRFFFELGEERAKLITHVSC